MLYNTPRMPAMGQRISASWGRSLIDAVRAGLPVAAPGMLLKRGMYGTSVIPMQEARSGGLTFSTAATALRPFTVRWYSHDTDGTQPDKGEWQIYLPVGCLVVEYGNGQTAQRIYCALPANSQAKDKDNNDIDRWYAIPTPTDANAIVKVSGDRAVKQWTVYALIKPWARFGVSTNPEGYNKVQWKVAVANITIAEWSEEDKDGGTVLRAERSVEALWSGAMVKEWDISKAFAIEYLLNDEKSPSSSHTAQVINQTKMLGRLQVNNVQPVNVTNATEVWIKINHSGTDFTLEVATSSGNEKSDDDKTIYKIYDLGTGGVVKGDYRDTIPTLPFYTNAAD